MSAPSTLNSLDIASAFKAVGDPMRLDILRIMCRDSFGVLELCQIFQVQQPSMSHHLKVMVKAGLLGSRREGNSIFYRRVQNAEGHQPLLDQIYAIADDGDVEPGVNQRVDEVQLARKQKSRQFFQENVDSFREQQDLIAGFSDYGEPVQDLMRFGKELTWLEVGAGAGELVESVQRKFKSSIALDISEELLQQCRRRVSADSSVKFFLGDTAEALATELVADCITCNMVLHHVPSPAKVIGESAQILAPNGQLLICDLDEHDQEWARTSCGDLWLGFSADEISQWARDAGLSEGRSEFLALKNGFRVQIREFLKGANE